MMPRRCHYTASQLTIPDDVLKEYGRYPSRNAALGRKSTEAEMKYLADGGGFGAK